MDSKLNNYRNDRLKKKLPVESQILSCAKEELAIKRKLVDQMESFESNYSENMSRISNNMEKLTSTISEGLTMLQHLVVAPASIAQYPYHHQYPAPTYSQSSSAQSYPFNIVEPDSP